MIQDVVIMIPAYNPDDKFIAFLRRLKEAEYKHIIVVDDGSRDDTKHYFREAKEIYHCHVVTHSVNLGQGRAYKSGFNYYLSETGGGDCPKTQKSILKVEDNILNMVVNKNKVNASNDFDISLAVKVENDGRSDTVFGQPGGGIQGQSG